MSTSYLDEVSMEKLEYPSFYNQLREWVLLSPDQYKRLLSVFSEYSVSRKEYVVRPGDSEHVFIFVLEGLLRFFYLADNGTETNKAFVDKNTFTGSLAAYILDLPIVYGIQALEDTRLLKANYRDFVDLYDQDPAFDRLGRKLAEWILVRKELRTRSLLQEKAEERYLTFCKECPSLVQRVPQYHIASYLGITEVSLSRLMREIYP